MQLRNPAAVALFLSSSLWAQTVTDPGTAQAINGEWDYSASSTGSDAMFKDAQGIVQLVVHCTRSNRQVSISKPSAQAAAYLDVWTSSQSRTMAASFNAAEARLSIAMDPNDPLLDALSNSRGRIGIRAGNATALVVPPWPEIARVVEDCRAS